MRGDTVNDDGRGKSAEEHRDVRNAAHDGSYRRRLCRGEHLAAENSAAIRPDEYRQDADRRDRADNAADTLGYPLRLRVGAEHGAGLEVVHHVAGKSRRDGDDGRDEHRLLNIEPAAELCDGHDEDTEYLHGVYARLADAL